MSHIDRYNTTSVMKTLVMNQFHVVNIFWLTFIVFRRLSGVVSSSEFWLHSSILKKPQKVLQKLLCLLKNSSSIANIASQSPSKSSSSSSSDSDPDPGSWSCSIESQRGWHDVDRLLSFTRKLTLIGPTQWPIRILQKLMIEHWSKANLIFRPN